MKINCTHRQLSAALGKLALSHPPPSAWISNTALAMRRPKMLTAVTSRSGCHGGVIIGANIPQSSSGLLILSHGCLQILVRNVDLLL
jgi:hypothetical protein